MTVVKAEVNQRQGSGSQSWARRQGRGAQAAEVGLFLASAQA